jgi:hypothetical protein
VRHVVQEPLKIGIENHLARPNYGLLQLLHIHSAIDFEVRCGGASRIFFPLLLLSPNLSTAYGVELARRP